jgi:hypothetical protein
MQIKKSENLLKKAGNWGFMALTAGTGVFSALMIMNYLGWVRWPIDYFAATCG